MTQNIFSPLSRIFRQPAFLVCCLVLGASAASLKIASNKLQWYFRKFPIALQKPLDQLDTTRIAPYRLVRAVDIQEEIIEELGTRDYLNWQIEDTSVPEKDPFRNALLFVTYYTGNPDKIPHTPDVCYVGSGGQVQQGENVKISVPNCGADNDTVPLRLLRINLPGAIGRHDQIILYTFSVNGTYCATRNEVRLKQNNLYDRYVYFSKVEMTFPAAPADDAQLHRQAAQKLARVFLPVLFKDHWPDWQALERKKNPEP
jgi:hypothetical protein